MPGNEQQRTGNRSVKFYTLSSLPSEVNDNSRDGCFINIKDSQDSNTPDGLYFCFNNHWKYLVNEGSGARSAYIYKNTVYFFESETAPALPTPSNPPSGYLFFITLPTYTEPADGNGILVDTSDGSVNLQLAIDTVTVSGTSPNQTITTHQGSENLLKINGFNELSINDKWDCGEYDNNIYRHLANLKSTSLKYTEILKINIPDGVNVTQVSAVNPNPTTQSPMYIQYTGNNHYFVLGAAKPQAASLEYGEVAVNYRKDNERLYIKNSDNDIVEFAPTNQYRNFVRNATFSNPSLVPSGNTCTWSISYTTITEAGIGILGAVVFLRENSTGKQLIPDVTFNTSTSTVDILIYSTTNISSGTYTAIVFGSNYNSI